MNERQQKLLKVIVEEYVAAAQPVGSLEIAKKYFSDLSPATIRNEMAELEEAGLIAQPYTSAGRMPTAAGYREFIKLFLADGAEIASRDKKFLDEVELSLDDAAIKSLAKAIAEICDRAVVVAFSSNDLYYTGISHLFRQPEFASAGWAYSMSEVIDGLEKILSKIYFTAAREPQILVGDDNPFGDMAASVTAKCEFGQREILLAILSPLRLDYQRTLDIVKYAQEKINNLK